MRCLVHGHMHTGLICFDIIYHNINQYSFNTDLWLFHPYTISVTLITVFIVIIVIAVMIVTMVITVIIVVVVVVVIIIINLPN